MPPALERPRRQRARGDWRVRECPMGIHHASDWGFSSRVSRNHPSEARRSWNQANPGVSLAAAVARMPRPTDTFFDELADRWEAETVFESVATRKAMHPAYQRIIGMGQPAVPKILRRLETEPAQWFWALTAITGEDPAVGQTTLDGAAAAWLSWGRARGLVRA